jgi:hypothetical protein
VTAEGVPSEAMQSNITKADRSLAFCIQGFEVGVDRQAWAG